MKEQDQAHHEVPITGATLTVEDPCIPSAVNVNLKLTVRYCMHHVLQLLASFLLFPRFIPTSFSTTLLALQC